MLLEKIDVFTLVPKDTLKKIYGNIENIDKLNPENAEAPKICEHKKKYIENLDNIQFIISPLVFLFNFKKHNVLYHSVSLKKVIGNDLVLKLWNFLKNNPGKTVQEMSSSLGINIDQLKILLEEGFLIDTKVDPYFPVKRIQKRTHFHKPHISLMYLLISNHCNLRCKYCSIEGDHKKTPDFSFTHMTNEIALKGIDLFLECLDPCAKEARIIYYGGEPLLNWEAIETSLEYIANKKNDPLLKNKKIETQLITNGMLLDREKIKLLKKHNVNISISLDGLKSHHDDARLTVSKGGSWEDSLAGYNMCREEGFTPGISCTMGKHNYKDADKIAEYFALDLETRGMGFNIIKGLPLKNEMEISHEEATISLIRAFEFLRKYGVYEDRMMRKVGSFVKEEPFFYDCAGYGGQFAVTPDGFIGPCHILAEDHKHVVGHINDPDIKEKILNGDLMKDWCRRSPLFMEECKDCVGLGICGGGCANEPISKGGKLFDMDETFCVHCKMVLEWLIKDMLKQITN